LEVTPEMVSVVEFPEGMTNGLVRDSVFVSVMARFPAVALRSNQKFPPADVAVDEGSVTALNPELVIWKKKL
jgi:hypothetical protein